MTMTTYYKATFSNGQVHLRATAGRKYTHAYVGNRYTLARACWSGTEQLARQAAKGAEIAPAIEITGQEYRTLKSLQRGDAS
jgi:hypothetical protein